MLLQEEEKKLREAIEENDTDLLLQMFQGNNIDVNVLIATVRTYVLLISTVYVTYLYTMVTRNYPMVYKLLTL